MLHTQYHWDSNSATPSSSLQIAFASLRYPWKVAIPNWFWQLTANLRRVPSSWQPCTSLPSNWWSPIQTWLYAQLQYLRSSDSSWLVPRVLPRGTRHWLSFAPRSFCSSLCLIPPKPYQSSSTVHKKAPQEWHCLNPHCYFFLFHESAVSFITPVYSVGHLIASSCELAPATAFRSCPFWARSLGSITYSMLSLTLSRTAWSTKHLAKICFSPPCNLPSS